MKRSSHSDIKARLEANKRKKEDARLEGHGVEYHMDAQIAKMQDHDAKRKVRPTILLCTPRRPVSVRDEFPGR